MSHNVGFRPEPNTNGEEVNAERFPVRAAAREAALRERVMMDILEKQRNLNNNNNNNNGINAEHFPNAVSEREKELRMQALTELERGNEREGMERYMFDRAAANDRYSRNVMNSILQYVPKRVALEAKEHSLQEKHVDKAARNAERKRLEEEEYMTSMAYIRARERYLATEAALRRLQEEEARLAELNRAEDARAGFRRENATIEGVPGRRNYIPPGPGRRKSRKSRKYANKTRRRY